MRLTKCFIVLPLCLLIAACALWRGDLEIDIGDYEAQLVAWNSQNMLDYQLWEEFSAPGWIEGALVTIKNGIPVSSDPSYWLEDNSNNTIPDYFSFIKRIERDIKDDHKKGSFTSYNLKVSYNTVYHYPHDITLKIDDYTKKWTIRLTPLGATERGVNKYGE
jgi:hypothetical protein